MLISLMVFYWGDRWLRAGSRKVQVARKRVVGAKSGGNLYFLGEQSITTAELLSRQKLAHQLSTSIDETRLNVGISPRASAFLVGRSLIQSGSHILTQDSGMTRRSRQLKCGIVKELSMGILHWLTSSIPWLGCFRLLQEKHCCGNIR